MATIVSLDQQYILGARSLLRVKKLLLRKERLGRPAMLF